MSRICCTFVFGAIKIQLHAVPADPPLLALRSGGAFEEPKMVSFPFVVQVDSLCLL